MNYIQAELQNTDSAADAHATETLYHDTPEPPQMIEIGLCSTCYNCGQCVWQQNNKIECEHFE